MAKKLIYTTVENIGVNTNSQTITIPANKKEYFCILSHKTGALPSTITYYVYNDTSESIPVNVISNNQQQTKTITIGPRSHESIIVHSGEILHIPDFKNYEDAIFVEWPKS